MTARITHPGTAIAERLDTLTAFNNATTTDPPPISTVEELATDLLLRHHLNQPEMHYHADETAWDKSADSQSTSEREDHPDSADDHQDGTDDTELPDEPPF
jgi:hypothetical protein